MNMPEQCSKSKIDRDAHSTFRGRFDVPAARGSPRMCFSYRVY
jgi:hypothetical protein